MVRHTFKRVTLLAVLRIDYNGKGDHLVDYYSQPGKSSGGSDQDGNSGGVRNSHILDIF